MGKQHGQAERPTELLGSVADARDAADRERERNRREIEQMQLLGDVRGKIYSAVLDADTCDACLAWDGIELALEDHRIEIPHPDCTGPEGCRCIWVYVMKDEAPSQVPSLKQPPW